MESKFVQTATTPTADFETTTTHLSEKEYTEDSTPLNEKSGFTDSMSIIVPIMNEESMRNFAEEWVKASNESGIVFLESSISHTAGCSTKKTSPTTKKNSSGDGSTGSSSTKTN